MAENFSRLNRIVKKDPYVTPSSPFEKFVANGGSGGGMPDASGLKDGTVMVAVGGKFVPVEGYGYSVGVDPYGPFYWDGVYHADDPDVIVASDSGMNLILKKIADDNSFINLSSSIHILEESGNEYDLTASSEDTDTSVILFMDSGFSHMAMLIRDPDVWSEMDIDANDTGLFAYITPIDIPSDGDQLWPPAEYTVVNSETVTVFDKKYIPTDLDYVTEDQVDSKINAKIISGTAEYEDGVTNLSNGAIYLQYEV